MITTEQIKELRDSTGVSVMQCKKALEEAGGDMKKAILILQKKSKDIATKKSGRTLKAGVVSAYIHSTGEIGTLIELFCETDFVSKNDAFRALAYDIALHAAATSPKFVNKEGIPEETIRATREIFAEDVAGKPKTIQDKILQGKLDAYWSERVLLEQPFVKNPDLTVRALIESAIQKFGEKIEVGRLARFSIKH